MNLLEINIDQKFILIGIGKKIYLLPFNHWKMNINTLTGKPKCILEVSDLINQIKLMSNKDDNSNFILAVDNSGILHCKKINYEYVKNKIEEIEYKKFNCRLEEPDNSIWSIDCFYPLVVVGGNNKCVIINDVEDKLQEQEEFIKNNYVYCGNKHNVPYVNFSPNGEFIANASIDCEVKIWDTYSGKLVKKISNKTKQWYILKIKL